MADFTLTQVARYPNGTEVKAYPESNWPNSQVKTDAAPLGSATSTKTMTDGTLTFSGLTAGDRYVAHAEVGGEHRYLAFTAGADVEPGSLAALSSQGTHAARPAPGVTGRLYFETDTHVLYRDTGTVWQATGPGFVSKTADETVNNSTTLQDDDHLFWPVENGEQWAFDGLLRISAVSVNADWKFGWSTPGGTMNWGVHGAAADFAPGAIAAVPVGTAASLVLGAGTTVAVGAQNGTQMVRIAGSANVSTAGTLKFQWAQNTATAENSVVNVRSHFWISRLV